MAFIPALFLGSAWVIFNFQNDFFWGWLVLLLFGSFSLLAFILQWKIYRFEGPDLIISGPFKVDTISKDQLKSHDRNSLTRRGIQYVTWKLILDDDKQITILSDYIANYEGFRKTMDQWLTSADE